MIEEATRQGDMFRDAPKPKSVQLTLDWQERDALGSYNDAITAIGERVKAGEPVPAFFRSIAEPAE